MQWWPSREAKAALDREAKEGKARSLADVLRTFEAKNPGYSVRFVSEVLRIEPRGDSSCGAALRRPVRDFSSTGPAIDVLQQLVMSTQGMKPGDVPRVGIVGSFSDPDARRRVANLQTPVTVSLRSASLAEALDAIVVRAPGVGWGVREAGVEPRPPQCLVMLIHGGPWPATTLSFPGEP